MFAIALPLSRVHVSLVATTVLLGWIPNRGYGQETDPAPLARMVAPGGFTGAINTPVAHVLGPGRMAVSLTNNNPEIIRSYKEGHFGSLNVGVGLLPGFEAVGRLSFEGDLNCNMYEVGCRGLSRDLSVGAKYQLPFSLWNNTKMALGVSDVGGATRQFRQYYGVITTRWQEAEASVGYAKARSTQALLQGGFGSLRYALLPSLQLLAEYDSHNTRAGVQYQWRMSDSNDLLVAYSRQLKRNSGQQANQVQIAFNFNLDRGKTAPVVRPPAASSEVLQTTAQAPIAVTHADPKADLANAAEIAELLKKEGFANIDVVHWPSQTGHDGLWHITAESRAYRQSHVGALGHALRPWLALVRNQRVASADRVRLILTYQREPVLYAYAVGGCLREWVQGSACTDTTLSPVTLSPTPLALPEFDPHAATMPSQVAKASASPAWAPQMAISPALRNTVGTEYGLFDYSLAMQLGFEVGLAPGLFWQGIYLVPVNHSDDYQEGKVFGASRFAKRQWHSSQITYWKPLIWGVKAQVNAGQLTPTDRGAQFDATWMSPDGRWRLGWTGGRYRSDVFRRVQVPEYAQIRYSVIPGTWQVEATAGTFMGSDKGFKLASVHWFGDTRFALQYQRTGSSIRPDMPDRAFMGFSVSVPLGPKAATALGPVTVRGQDRWNWGLQTKVGEKDNYITTGYGDFPRQRHGLWSDAIDHDRSGSADLYAQRERLRSLLNE